ncbi:hypothetical protein [Streptomyces sp. NPDC001933]|uniref:hypothetical protein n=1 Tax=Streptomyces sp. NPDC001933 TaxID=3364626 RepID=UPI0036C4D442
MRSPADLPMARNFDDDAPRRIQDANKLALARQREADEQIYVVTTNFVIEPRKSSPGADGWTTSGGPGRPSAGCP